MNSLRCLLPLLTPAILAGTSCSTVEKVRDTTLAGVRKVGDYATAPFQPKVPVVEPRRGEWRKLPTGRERAEAYLAERRWFGPRGDFEEPDLPELAEDSATSLLLPPKN